MNEIVASRLDEITELCRRYHVRRLDLFGSATSERFDPERSDLDFAVEFEGGLPPGQLGESYLGLLIALEDLFGRPIDLVTTKSIRNPYFRANVEETRRLLYAA